jgi:hypothetical protein
MRHVFAGCLRELKNTMFCIIDAGCCPFLKRLEGNKKQLCIYFSSFKFRMLSQPCVTKSMHPLNLGSVPATNDRVTGTIVRVVVDR